MRAGGCPAVVAQWQSTGGSSQRCPGFDSTAGFFTFLYFRLITSKFIYLVPGLLTLFLVVEQPLLHPKVHKHPAHPTLASSNSAALLPLALEKANHGAQIFALELALCLCWS